MESLTYRVVFEGETLRGKDKAEIKANLASVFKLTNDSAERFLNQKRAVVKKGVSLAAANNLLTALIKAGVMAKIESEESVTPIASNPVEKPRPVISEKIDSSTQKPEPQPDKTSALNNPPKKPLPKRAAGALKSCKDCGTLVSKKARSCPNCGSPIKKKTSLLTWIVTVFIVLSAIGYIADSLTPSSKPISGLKLPSFGKQMVTFDEYQKIENGMSYNQVVAIIGVEGEEISSNKTEGVSGVMPSVETIMYQWVNKNGSNINIMFQNDKLMQKAQFGLK